MNVYANLQNCGYTNLRYNCSNIEPFSSPTFQVAFRGHGHGFSHHRDELSMSFVDLRNKRLVNLIMSVSSSNQRQRKNNYERIGVTQLLVEFNLIVCFREIIEHGIQSDSFTSGIKILSIVLVSETKPKHSGENLVRACCKSQTLQI